MSTPAVVILGCAVVTFAIKATGPVALGGRALPARMQNVLALMAAPLLAALVVVSVLADGERIAVGANTAGVASATLVYARTGSIVGCVACSAIVTALLRAL